MDKEKGMKIGLRQIEDDIRIRDKKDKTRPVGALKRAKDAILIDTTNMAIPQVVKKALSYI